MADPYLFKRVLDKTGLHNILEATRADLIEAFEETEGRDRSDFDFPQVRTRSNEGLYDRRVLPTETAMLRAKAALICCQASVIDVSSSPSPESLCPTIGIDTLAKESGLGLKRRRGTDQPCRSPKRTKQQPSLPLLPPPPPPPPPPCPPPPSRRRRRPRRSVGRGKYVAFEVPSGAVDDSSEELDNDMKHTFLVGTNGSLYRDDNIVKDCRYP